MMKLYWRYVALHVRSSMQYRFGFFMGVVATAMTTITAYMAIYQLFRRFGSLSGYTLGEVALCFGVAYSGFSVAECFARGFDLFGRVIRSGDYDRLLLRPQSMLSQVFCAQFEINRIGRVGFGLAVLLVAAAMLDIVWSPWRIATLVLMLAGSIVIFVGVFVATSSFCFVTIQGLEVLNVFTDGGREIASYPLTIFPKAVRLFFTFILPFGVFNYLPLLYLSGRSAQPLFGLLPLVSLPFLALCCLLWMRVSRRYLSTGS